MGPPLYQQIADDLRSNFGVVPEPQYDLPWPDDQTDPEQPDQHEFSWPNSGDHPSSED